MTTEQLPAGMDLDRLVAERVLGWTDVRARNTGAGVMVFGRDPAGNVRTLRPFSGDIRCAWEVVEAMQARGYRYRLNDYGPKRSFHCAAFFNDQEYGALIHGDTAPHAICLAALAALGSGVL
jgi:hypothetical protein